MKYNNVKSFFKAIKDSSVYPPAPVYFIYGKDKVDLNEVFDFLKKTFSQFKVEQTWQSEDIELSDIQQDLETMSMFSFETTIYVFKEASLLSSSCLRYMQRYLVNPDLKKSLWFFSSHPFSSSVMSLIEKLGVILEIPEPKPWEKESFILSWIGSKLDKEGKKITPEAARKLVDLLGSDKQSLDQELDKLALFVGDKNSIGLEDVTSVTSCGVSETIWDFVDSLQKKEKGHALRIGFKLYEQGEALIGLVAHIRQQFQMGLLLLESLHDEKEKIEVLKKYPFLKGKLLEKKIEQALKFGARHYRKGLVILFELDCDLRNQTRDPYLTLSILIERLLDD